MKSKIFFIVFLFSSLFCFAEKVDLTFIMEDNSTWIYSVDKNIETLTLFIGDSNSSLPKTYFSDVKGFDQLENLSTLELYSAKCSGDYSFLSEIKNLRDLGLIVCYINSLDFLSNLPNLESTEIETMTDINYKDKIETQEIDLERLTKLRKIQLEIKYFDGRKIVQKLERIPPFIKVQNKPELLLHYNDIKELTEKDKNYCRQYSRISFSGNPIEKKLKNEQ